MAAQEDPVKDFDWPDDMPDRCPPLEAHCSYGTEFFRFVKKKDDFDAVTEKDFVRPRDLPRRNPIPDNELCAFSALSVFMDLNDVVTARNFVPGFNRKQVAKGAVQVDHGLIHNTPQPAEDKANEVVHIMKSHYDWWVPVNVQPHTFFRVVTI